MLSNVALCSDLLVVYVELMVVLTLLLHRSFHRQQWAAVMEELCYSTACIDDDDDDDGYDSPPVQQHKYTDEQYPGENSTSKMANVRGLLVLSFVCLLLCQMMSLSEACRKVER
ncbi:hypothetical protein LSAT2_032950 [Lamellibrachia satsuma]|nr:hypothetical protein LSAT2_032950 [Lamellibrachia satsuma]